MRNFEMGQFFYLQNPSTLPHKFEFSELFAKACWSRRNERRISLNEKEKEAQGGNVGKFVRCFTDHSQQLTNIEKFS